MNDEEHAIPNKVRDEVYVMYNVAHKRFMQSDLHSRTKRVITFKKFHYE